VGVAVEGPVGRGATSLGDQVVAVVDSAPVGALVADMLTRSDNEIAEALVREIGHGSTAAGAAAVEAVLRPWCLHLGGAVSDGSGLSRSDFRSARDWRRLLQVAAEQPWAADLAAGLPVAGRSGTLAGRLGGPTVRGNVRAKTGTIIGGSSLSGYATTTDGRAVVFSVVVNGEPAVAARANPAIDRLVTAAVGP
jgi:D-alanyl-D-alanine carboxypeptidase/D-alanyl-D-alanine-endopeptidase (penicillin-binding protein 4)